MLSEEFATLANMSMNMLALADNPLSEFGQADFKCPHCKTVVAELTGVVSLPNGTTLVPCVSIRAVNEISAALAAHMILSHRGIVSEWIREWREKQSQNGA